LRGPFWWECSRVCSAAMGKVDSTQWLAGAVRVLQKRIESLETQLHHLGDTKVAGEGVKASSYASPFAFNPLAPEFVPVQHIDYFDAAAVGGDLEEQVLRCSEEGGLEEGDHEEGDTKSDTGVLLQVLGELGVPDEDYVCPHCDLPRLLSPEDYICPECERRIDREEEFGESGVLDEDFVCPHCDLPRLLSPEDYICPECERRIDGEEEDDGGGSLRVESTAEVAKRKWDTLQALIHNEADRVLAIVQEGPKGGVDVDDFPELYRSRWSVEFPFDSMSDFNSVLFSNPNLFKQVFDKAKGKWKIVAVT